ncbi:MAG TPA: hypothetical protein VLR29_08640, partial [Flavobacterium sp.]|nr:hypothetical protein [Flavobacterium sp.]
MKKVFLILLLLVTSTYAQISGCTDPLSLNFNPKATNNDGSCRYISAKIKPESSNNLNDSLTETSGLITFDNL